MRRLARVATQKLEDEMGHVLRVIWWLLGSLVLVGCAASDFVTSQTSAVESAPAPEEDLRKLNYYCHNSCLIRVGQCYSGCANEDTEVQCDGQCEDALANCQDMCERIFPW